MPGIGQGIIGSFEQIGKDIATETAKVPVDVVGSALESLGSGGQKKSTTTPPVVAPDGSAPKDTPLDQLNTATSEQTKRTIARSALEQLAGRKQHEPTVWEQLQKESTEKKDQKALAAKQQAMVLTPVKGKAKRGSAYGIKQKSSSEMSKNARQD